jgi:uncharacterized protein (TIGR02271 family)
MSRQIITGFFDKRNDAAEAIEHLVKEGVPRTSIRLMPGNETPSTPTTGSYDISGDEKGFWDSLRDFFFPEEDRYTYAEAMNRGSIMVSVTVDEVQAVRAEDILNEHNTVDIDEREATWRQEGWPGYAGTASASAGRKTPGEGEVIPVVEEQLKVGKRQVSGGRVNVRSYVVETPVSEQVSLRDETVRVERRPVDQPVTEVNSAAFQPRTIETEERHEEPVVAKEARVKEEVVVAKTAEQHTETVKDKVRRTEVEVDDERTGGRAAPSQNNTNTSRR